MPLPRAAAVPAVHHDVTRFTEDDLYLFNQGTHFRLYDKLGAHLMERDGVPGVYFAVWAPLARGVAIVGTFNAWDGDRHGMAPRGQSGIWEAFVPGVGPRAVYKYLVESSTGESCAKADPFGILHEVPPRTASMVWELGYEWRDAAWMAERGARQGPSMPISLYETHLGSWRRTGGEENRSLTYRELARDLPAYARRLGFTHVELMPVMEHPYYASWGYQITGYYAPSARYGSPQDFMALVDALHNEGVGVVLDWVPSHFPVDPHGLARFNGFPLYEHGDRRRGWHPDWKSLVFDYGRPEVRSFLISNAVFWLERYHADALRVDAVASMLYLDYSRKEGEWAPNEHGGKEHLEAVDFLRRMNSEVYRSQPAAVTVAEESTAWPGVSRPVYNGGLGFGFKWDMGWMHDTLRYLRRPPHHRKFHHNEITFRALYAFAENYLLALSHDEVVHGKGSLLGQMPGDSAQKFANLRLLYGLMFLQPGKKLLFMGSELAPWREWNHDAMLEWELLDHSTHAGISAWVSDLNAAYRRERALHQWDCDRRGFEWVDCHAAEESVLSWQRRCDDPAATVIAVCNFTTVARPGYRVGVPAAGRWSEILNSDAAVYGGTGMGNEGGVESAAVPVHGKENSIEIALPPLTVLAFRLA